MKHSVLIISLLTVLAGCGNSDQKEKLTIRIPGEFEPQSALWLGLNTQETEKYDSTTIQIIKELNGLIELNLIVEHDSLLPDGKMLFAKIGLDTSMIHIIYQSPTDIWFRDPGPVFGITPDNKLAIADFKYTNYSNLPPDSISDKAKAHEAIDRDIAERLNIPSVKSLVAMEGGAFETNGKGVLIQVENITLKRNPHLTKQEIENDFEENFGMKEVIWLPSGVADDPHNFSRIYENIFGLATGGHTDEFVRFANDTTIIMSWVSDEEKNNHPINRLNYEILSKNYEILKNYVTKNGSHFTVIKIPHPEPKTYDLAVTKERFSPGMIRKFNLYEGDTITMAYASSYLNYLITDKAVLLPQYWSMSKPLSVKKKDDQVRTIFMNLYPDRKIIGINPIALNSHGGGMHCRYQSQPRVN